MDGSGIQPLTIILSLISFVIWLWAIIDICLRRFDDVNTKIGWVIGIVLCGGCGGILYLAFGREGGTIQS
jgi:hypothetical protein